MKVYCVEIFSVPKFFQFNKFNTENKSITYFEINLVTLKYNIQRVMHSLNLTYIHSSPQTLPWFNWVFYILNLYNSCLFSNYVKNFPLRKLTNEKRYFEKQILTQ